MKKKKLKVKNPRKRLTVTLKGNFFNSEKRLTGVVCVHQSHRADGQLVGPEQPKLVRYVTRVVN